MLGILKLARILRLSRLTTFMNLKDDVKISLKIFRLLFFITLYLHFVGCMWWFLVKNPKNWIPPLDYVYVKTDIFDESVFNQY